MHKKELTCCAKCAARRAGRRAPPLGGAGRGIALIELVVATAIVTIPILVIGMILADSQRGWNTMYNRIHSDAANDSYVARRMFEAVIRKASGEKVLLDDNGNWVEIYYYADSDSTVVDRYARFYESGGVLNIEYGVLDPQETVSTRTVCGNVSDCTFKQAGQSAQMILTLDDGERTVTVVSSAVMHN